eukprot:1144291-Pelagomonas_calceolata.AAC.2
MGCQDTVMAASLSQPDRAVGASEGIFLAGPGLGIVMRSFEYLLGYHRLTACWQKHEGGHSPCIEDGRLDGVPQG